MSHKSLILISLFKKHQEKLYQEKHIKIIVLEILWFFIADADEISAFLVEKKSRKQI